MTRPFDGDGPGATTVIKAGGHFVNKLPVGYTSIPLAILASRWLNKLPSRWTSPRGLAVFIDSPSAKQAPRWLDKHTAARTALDQQI